MRREFFPPRRLCSVLLAASMTLSLTPSALGAGTGETAPAAEEMDAAELLADTSQCGRNARWSLEKGTLSITGSGDMTDFSYGSAPWYDQRGEIRAV